MSVLLAWGANSRGQLGVDVCEQHVIPVTVPLDIYPADIQSITGGGNHTFLVTKDALYGTGSNSKSQLGHGTTPLFAKLDILASSVSSKWDTSLAIDLSGNCVGWGDNGFGQLGNKTSTEVRSPALLQRDCTQASAGLRHSLILTKSGEVFSSGDNAKGQLGRTTTADDPIFQKVEGLATIKFIASGENHNVAVSNSNDVYVWGCNKFGQCGRDPYNVSFVPSPEVIVTLKEDIVKVMSGWTHSGVLTARGELLNWGRNKYCQLGIPPSPYELPQMRLKLMFKDVVFGAQHNLGITVSGELMAWGWNEHGSCGTGNTSDVAAPTCLNVQNVTKIGAGAGQSFAVAQR